MPHTLLLNDAWDIYLDAAGNIAHEAGDYAIAQNAANAVRLFTNDAYFNLDRGIPHLELELGQPPESGKTPLETAIRDFVITLDGVKDAAVTLEFEKDSRTFGGEITIETENGTQVSVEL